MKKSITIITPDDFHVHLRDHSLLEETVPRIARAFNRALIMPNLYPPITNISEAQSYYKRINASVNNNEKFEPLMTLYLTDNTTVDMVFRVKNVQNIVAFKLYPAGSTTNSSLGVTSIKKIYSVIGAMEECGIPLLIHAEVTSQEIDIFDREKQFIDLYLEDIVSSFPKLKIVVEHITTSDAVDFVVSQPHNIAATITAHHLMYNRNAMLAGGIKPHYYCLPILKRNRHQKALLNAIISGNPKFFLGTDSAPHDKNNKESNCGCAGCYTAPISIEMYAEIFDQCNVLDKLEGFSSFYGADFYGLERSKDKITLVKEPWEVPHSISYKGGTIIPLRAGEICQWKLLTTKG